MVHTRTAFKLRQLDGGVSIIDVQGEITALAENEIVPVFCQAVLPGANVIIWNFTQLDYINSSGIGLLLTMLIRARKQGVRMYAYGLNGHYLRVFEMSRLDEAIQMYDSEESALKALVLVQGER